MKILFTALSIVLTFLYVSCKSASSGPSPKPESSYQLPDQITLTAWAVRDAATRGTVIEGTTNLPSNTKLGIELMHGEAPMAQDFQVYVDSGNFRSAPFLVGAPALPPGKQKVHVFTYFNTFWQSEAVLKLVGKGGSKLKASAIIHSEDPQLIDADNLLDYTVELTIPPLATAPAQNKVPARPEASLDNKAIEMVKKATLVVDGRRSSMTVEGGVAYYFTLPGLRMGNGWSATQTSKDTYNVALDYIGSYGRPGEPQQERHDTAIWEVNLVTKEVLYRNKHAKNFSWIPDY